MGVYRVLLALSVLLAHLGGAGWLSPRMAVAAFFIVSGYLIFQVLDKAYLDREEGLRAFYLNRALRLVPLLVVMMAAGFIAMSLYGENGVRQDDGSYAAFIDPYINSHPWEALASDATFLFHPKIGFEGWVPYFCFLPPYSLGPAWTIGNEMLFYLAAPALLILLRRSFPAFGAATIAMVVLYAAAGWSGGDYGTTTHGNVLVNISLFMLGGLLYELSRRIAWRAPAKVMLLVLPVAFYLIWFWVTSIDPDVTRMNEWNVLPMVLLTAVPLTALVIFTEVPPGLKRFDDGIGKLSYGVYLNHFFVAFCMLMLQEYLHHVLNSDRVFGIANRPAFGFHATIFSLVLAFVTYRLIERPIETMRDRIRNRETRSARVAAKVPVLPPAPAE
jgi:peptidoglycan/LPS O-acetylase OafA/YrhL